MNYFEWRKLVDQLRHWSTDWLTNLELWWTDCKWPARLTLPRCQGVKVSRLSQQRRVGCCILFAYRVRGKCDMEMYVPGKASHAHTFQYQLTLKWKQLFPPDNALVWSDCPTKYMRVLDMDHVLCSWLINCRPRRKCLAETHTLRGFMFFVVCKQINWTAIINSFNAN